MTSQTTSPAKQPAAGGKGGKGKGPGRIFRSSLFVRETVAEMRKVIYPTRKEIINYTAVVLVFVTGVILIVAGLDAAFTWVVLQIFG